MACGHSTERTTDTEGHKMRLVTIFAAILAVSIVECSDETHEDLEALETMELQKVRSDLTPDASSYSYVPQTTWTQNQPQNYPQSNPSNNYVTSSSYIPPATSAPYIPPAQTGSQNYPAQQTYYPSQTWTPPNYHVPTTTTPVPVIKNEMTYGENGSYRYEYQIADGTHVGEEGYYVGNNASDQNLVKKGWYTFKGADGVVYTVTYWADKTGYHAFGSHLPQPPPIPPAIQASLDAQEAEKNKPTTTTTQKPPVYYPQTDNAYYPNQPANNVPQQSYNPPQQSYNPPQQSYNPPQQSYNPPQQSYNPPQESYKPPQQSYNPTQPINNPPQQTYYPPQQTYYPSQQTYYPQQTSNPGYGK